MRLLTLAEFLRDLRGPLQNPVVLSGGDVAQVNISEAEAMSQFLESELPGSVMRRLWRDGDARFTWENICNPLKMGEAAGQAPKTLCMLSDAPHCGRVVSIDDLSRGAYGEQRQLRESRFRDVRVEFATAPQPYFDSIDESIRTLALVNECGERLGVLAQSRYELDTTGGVTITGDSVKECSRIVHQLGGMEPQGGVDAAAKKLAELLETLSPARGQMGEFSELLDRAEKELEFDETGIVEISEGQNEWRALLTACVAVQQLCRGANPDNLGIPLEDLHLRPGTDSFRLQQDWLTRHNRGAA